MSTYPAFAHTTSTSPCPRRCDSPGPLRFVPSHVSAVSEANCTKVPVSLDSGVRFRYSRQKEAARGCGGRGVLWEFNRFLPEKLCQTGTLLKTLLLRPIGAEFLVTICVILPPAPSVLQEGSSEGSSDACVYTRGSVRRASGFVVCWACSTAGR